MEILTTLITIIFTLILTVKITEKNLYQYAEMRKIKEIPNEIMHKMLIEYPNAEISHKIIDAKMKPFKPTRNPFVLLYRMLRDR